jgi:hypothetical protein
MLTIGQLINYLTYLTNAAGPVPLVLDLRIEHHRWGSISNPSLNGNLHYPNDIDRKLKKDATDKILQYHAYYNNRPSHVISFITPIVSTSGRLHMNLCVFYLYRLIGKLTDFL